MKVRFSNYYIRQVEADQGHVSIRKKVAADHIMSVQIAIIE